MRAVNQLKDDVDICRTGGSWTGLRNDSLGELEVVYATHPCRPGLNGACRVERRCDDAKNCLGGLLEGRRPREVGAHFVVPVLKGEEAPLVLSLYLYIKLERETKVPDHASGLQEMRAAEGREIVIESKMSDRIEQSWLGNLELWGWMWIARTTPKSSAPRNSV